MCYVFLLLWIPFISFSEREGSLTSFFQIPKQTIDVPAIESAVESKDQTAYSHCSCFRIKETRDCSPECFLYCVLSGAFVEAEAVMNNECGESKETVVLTEESGLLGLSSTYREAGERISELENDIKPLPVKKDCEHCSEVSRIMNLTQPYKFKEKSCKSKYIKVHFYDKEVIFNGKAPCTEEERKELIGQLQNYGNYIIRGKGEDADTKEKSKRLYNSCPGGCSFYVNSVITLDKEICSGKIDLIVNCHHKKASDYKVYFLHYQQKQCPKEN